MAPDEIRESVHQALEAVNMTRFRTFAPHLLSGAKSSAWPSPGRSP